MAEGVEVQIITEQLGKVLIGSSVSRVVLHNEERFGKLLQTSNPDKVSTLVGQVFETVNRKGKYITIRFQSGYGIILHLMMTGQLHWLKNDISPEKKDWVFALEVGDYTLWFRDPRGFGKLWIGVFEQLMAMERMTHLGPDFKLVTRPDFQSRIAANRRKVLKVILLDQKVITGIGNIYGDEISAAAGILPTRVINTLSDSDYDKLYSCMHSVMGRSYELGGSTISDYIHIDGAVGKFAHEFRVFGRKTCRICGGPISRVILAGRYSHFCTNCQA